MHGPKACSWYYATHMCCFCPSLVCPTATAAQRRALHGVFKVWQYGTAPQLNTMPTCCRVSTGAVCPVPHLGASHASCTAKKRSGMPQYTARVAQCRAAVTCNCMSLDVTVSYPPWLGDRRLCRMMLTIPHRMLYRRCAHPLPLPCEFWLSCCGGRTGQATILIPAVTTSLFLRCTLHTTWPCMRAMQAAVRMGAARGVQKVPKCRIMCSDRMQTRVQSCAA